MRVWKLLPSLAVTLLALGCGGVNYMVRATPPQPFQAPPGQALIVFMRPSAYAGGNAFNLADGQGNYLGQIDGRQYVLHAVPQGQHTFIAWGENADMVQINAQAGLVYYALVGVRMGMWSARLSISALTPRRQEWPNLVQWLQISTQMAMDPGVAATYPPRADVTQRQLYAAQQAWAAYSEEDRAARILQVSDGMGPPPI